MTTKGKTIFGVAAFLLAAHSTPAQTLLLNYNFDEASSGTTPALDLGAAPAAPGTFAGTATRTGNTPGGFSLGALDLTGTTSPDHVSAGDADKLDGLGQFTLTGWINLQGSPANGNRIMAKQVTSGDFNGFSFALSNPTEGTISASNFQLNIALGGSGFAFVTSGANMSADNEWRFVALTYDGSQTADNVTFYNGGVDSEVVQFGNVGSSTVGAMIANESEFRVGATSGAGGSGPLLIDDVRVYSGVLDAASLDAVRLSAVPEPSVTALFIGGAAALLGLRKRRG